MNQDPVYNRLREASWRRPLTEGEQAELRAWLVAHPEARMEWETDAALNAVLNQLPAAPVPSNFTARVLQAVRREPVEVQPPGLRWPWRWHMWLSRAAAAACVISLGLLVHHRHEIRERNYAVGIVATAPEVKPEVLEDFEAIRRLGSAPQPDEELLALMR